MGHSVNLEYDFMADTEPDYDYGFVKIEVDGTVYPSPRTTFR